MIAALGIALAIQAAALVADELWFHRRRDVPRWERIGHPLDTLSFALCVAWLLAVPATASYGPPVYIGLAIGSTLFITKDEWVHARLCSGGEHWLHAVLFVVHPIVLVGLGALWWTGEHRAVVSGLLVALVVLAGYQLVYWNAIRGRVRAAPEVNNQWYAGVGARWYDADDDPIALLRAESRHRNPWIAARLGSAACDVLDLGCGGGFLANDMAARGHRVTGIDLTEENLAIARERDRTGSVRYMRGDACALPYDDASFDAVCAMDLLEHVETPERLIGEAARVLRPGGQLFAHTFNRTWQAHLIIIKGVEWFVRNTPPDLHVIRLFVTPGEVAAMCERAGLAGFEVCGTRPRFSRALLRMLVTRRVGDDFAFTFTRSTKLGYLAYARKPRARSS